MQDILQSSAVKREPEWPTSNDFPFKITVLPPDFLPSASAKTPTPHQAGQRSCRWQCHSIPSDMMGKRDIQSALMQGNRLFPATKLKATCSVQGDLVLSQFQRKMTGFTALWELWNHGSLGLHIQVSSVPLRPCIRAAVLGDSACGRHSSQILDYLGLSRHFLGSDLSSPPDAKLLLLSAAVVVSSFYISIPFA